jgi:hypothetical protein
MTRKHERRFFLETSAVIYRLHGHSLMQQAVQETIGDATAEVSPFVRMEYLRGVVLNLIELYFLLQKSESVGDALIDWSQKIRQERKLKVVLMTAHRWIVAQEDWQHRHDSLRRLAEVIVRSVREFDDAFPVGATDALRCQLGKVEVLDQLFHEQLVRNLYESLRRIQTGIPECALCRFRKIQQRRLRNRRIDLYGEATRKHFAAYPAFVRLAHQLDGLLTTVGTQPSCRYCEQVGDAILALHAPRHAVLVTADRAFIPLGQLLGREVVLLPSLVELKRRVAHVESDGEEVPTGH